MILGTVCLFQSDPGEEKQTHGRAAAVVCSQVTLRRIAQYGTYTADVGE